ncbi:hypothetical protein [Pseudokineococcus sp. 1T1Z-3]|uniref:hypothetical protein n=1 Tax=Pseudokineococcus sp. 1T1Z-3 TaxID=3132745 RepID=UPI0030A08CBC
MGGGVLVAVLVVAVLLGGVPALARRRAELGAWHVGARATTSRPSGAHRAAAPARASVGRPAEQLGARVVTTLSPLASVPPLSSVPRREPGAARVLDRRQGVPRPRCAGGSASRAPLLVRGQVPPATSSATPELADELADPGTRARDAAEERATRARVARALREAPTAALAVTSPATSSSTSPATSPVPPPSDAGAGSCPTRELPVVGGAGTPTQDRGRSSSADVPRQRSRRRDGRAPGRRPAARRGHTLVLAALLATALAVVGLAVAGHVPLVVAALAPALVAVHLVLLRRAAVARRRTARQQHRRAAAASRAARVAAAAAAAAESRAEEARLAERDRPVFFDLDVPVERPRRPTTAGGVVTGPLTSLTDLRAAAAAEAAEGVRGPSVLAPPVEQPPAEQPPAPAVGRARRRRSA